MPEPSEMDKEYYLLCREHIRLFRERHLPTAGRTLEVGPAHAVGWETLDVKPGCTFNCDITDGYAVGNLIKPATFDCVIAQEVLEHTTDPFSALENMRWILKEGGLLIASAPFNFREHGPLPDCWRFTRHGWRVLLRDWADVRIEVLMTPGRPLMPMHINASARCSKDRMTDVQTMKFPLEKT